MRNSIESVARNIVDHAKVAGAVTLAALTFGAAPAAAVEDAGFCHAAIAQTMPKEYMGAAQKANSGASFSPTTVSASGNVNTPPHAASSEWCAKPAQP